MKQSRGRLNICVALQRKFKSDPVVQNIRNPPQDEIFFVQNAGAPAAGTGLNKSSVIQKISLAEAKAVRNGLLTTVTVTVVNTSSPQIINPNGACSLSELQFQSCGSLIHCRRHELPGPDHIRR